MGGGKSSGSQSVQMTPEQHDLLAAQGKFLTDTAFPTYQKTIGSAGNVYTGITPQVTSASEKATNVASQTGGLQQDVGGASLVGGTAGLASLFGPQYEQEQVDAALQAGRESGRETQAQQNAMYGSAGGLGSSRMALADRSLKSIIEQRQATAAAAARAAVQAQKATAATSLIGAGQTGLKAANEAAAAKISYATSPLDAFAKYASIIYGTPQASTTPNFAGTQSSTGSSKSSGFKL
jgi:hypothetical protein